MTATTARALDILKDGPLLPEDFYLQMWPQGKWAQRDPGSSRGGPSRTQCAANWFLGRLEKQGLVSRQPYIGGDGRWRLTAQAKARDFTTGVDA